MGVTEWFQTFVLEDPVTVWMLCFSAAMGVVLAIAAKYSKQ
jgi:hypothetical protein